MKLIVGIGGLRGQTLAVWYDQNAERISMMPASGNSKYHNAFPGGYIAHVLNVHANAFILYNAWKATGAYTGDFEYSELVFAALNHDLGKFGTEEGEYYVPQTSDWHRDRGEIYKHNDAIPFMKTSDRSLFILQSLGVQLSENEYMAIKLHDGLYEESNKGYLVSYSDSYRLRSHLAYILHQADLMASRIEYDNVNRKPFVSQTITFDPSLQSKSTFLPKLGITITDETITTSDGVSEPNRKLYIQDFKIPNTKRKVSTKLPGINNDEVIPSEPIIIKENRSKPVNKKAVGKYAHLLNKK